MEKFITSHVARG